MSIKTFIIGKVGAVIAGQISIWKQNAVSDQKSIMIDLLKKAQNTSFGKEVKTMKMLNIK